MDKLISVEKNKVFTSEILINKSRFLCFAKHIENKEESEEFLNEIRKKYADARHICYAYRLKNTSKASDDGEPGGTAGRPMLLVLEKQNLYDIIAVVVRYFGGIKLGAGGLLRAYSNAVTECIDNAQKVEWELAKLYRIKMDYKAYKPFLNSIKNRKVQVLSADFSEGACLEVVASMQENLADAEFLGEMMHSFEKGDNF